MNAKTSNGLSGSISRGSTEFLTAQFVAAASNHGASIEAGRHRLANREYKRYNRARRKLLMKGNSGHLALRQLMSHANPWVRVAAARSCLGLFADEASRVLQALQEDPGFVGLSAKWVLKEWRAGHLKP